MLLGTLCAFFSVQAQDSVNFNGKTYKVFPQIVDGMFESDYKWYVDLEGRLQDIQMPPVFSALEDGDYLLYAIMTDPDKEDYSNRDTIRWVYATFQIKNGKKEGLANIYRFKDQKKPALQIPYSNDMINGSFYVSIDEPSQLVNMAHNNYDLDNESNTRKVVYDKVNSAFALLNYKDGLPFGAQYYSLVGHGKDTLPMVSLHVENGQMQGSVDVFKYHVVRRKLKLEFSEHRHYTKGKLSGEFIRKYPDGRKKTVIYGASGVEYEKFENNGSLVYQKIYDKDTVARYYKEGNRQVMMPWRNVGDNYDDINKDFVYFRYKDDKRIDVSLKCGMKVSPNYYKYNTNYRDTVLFEHQLIYIDYKRKDRYEGKAYEMVRHYYALDECGSQENAYISSGVCMGLFISDYYDKRQRLVKRLFQGAYFKPYLKDSSLKTVFVEKLEDDNLSVFKYYCPKLNYAYWNLYYHNGMFKGCREYFQVSGTISDGSVLRIFKMPTNEPDSLTLIDTLIWNGKPLYTEDKVYEEMVLSSYISLDYLGLYKPYQMIFVDDLKEYFFPRPEMHRCVLLGNERFTGPTDIVFTYRKHPKAFSVDVRRERFLGLEESSLLLNFELNEVEFENYRYWTLNEVFPVWRIGCYLQNGHFEKGFTVHDVYGQLSLSVPLSRNLIDGGVLFSQYEKSAYNVFVPLNIILGRDRPVKIPRRKYGKMRLGELDKRQSSTLIYKMGKKEGQWILHQEYFTTIQTYKAGKLEGKAYELQSHNGVNEWYLSSITNFKNDTIDGEYWKFDIMGKPLFKGSFAMDKPDGEFVDYGNLDSSGGKFYKKVTYDMGYQIGDYHENDFEGKPKLKILLDTSNNKYLDWRIYSYSEADYTAEEYDGVRYYHGKRSNMPKNGKADRYDLYMGYLRYEDWFSMHVASSGQVIYYSSDGSVFAEGMISEYRPVGEWRFYRPGGKSLYKLIVYKDSTLVFSADTFESFGKVTAYYSNGKKMFVGYASEDLVSYSCESEEYFPIEDDLYVEFYDTLGTALPLYDSCKVVECYPNGIVLKEGLIINGMKEGVWVYYNKYGLPNMMGVFKNGKKEGRWLSGDLGGLNLNEQICFLSEEDFEKWIKDYGNMLDLQESFYIDGMLMWHNEVDTINED